MRVTREPTLEQVRIFFERMNGQRHDCIHVNKFFRFFAWFKCMCVLTLFGAFFRHALTLFRCRQDLGSRVEHIKRFRRGSPTTPPANVLYMLYSRPQILSAILECNVKRMYR